MKNYIAPGDVIPFTAAADLAGGSGVMVGTLFGIVAADVKENAAGLAKTSGVFALPKPGTQAWTVGAKVYWDAVASKATTVAGGNVLIGTAYEAVGAGAGETSGKVRLTVIPAEPGAGVVAGFTMAAAAGGANVSEVTITAVDANGDAVAAPVHFDVTLSDDADGEGLTATTASGTVQAKSNSGTVLAALMAKKALRVQTKKNGKFVLEITDTAKTKFKVCASVPGSGLVIVGVTLDTADYG